MDESYPSSFILLGKPNAGKTTAAQMLSYVGFPTYEIGDTVKNLKRNSDYEESEGGSFIKELQSEEENDIFARKTVDLYGIDPETEKVPVISGVRQPEEKEFLEDYFGDAETVAIKAGEDTRNLRNFAERFGKTNYNLEYENQVDSEVDRSVQEMISDADRYLENEGSIEDLANEITETLDFKPHLYDVNRSVFNIVPEVTFEYSDHAEGYSNDSNLSLRLRENSIIVLDLTRSKGQIETDIQNFYTQLMTEAVE